MSYTETASDTLVNSIGEESLVDPSFDQIDGEDRAHLAVSFPRGYYATNYAASRSRQGDR